MEIINGEINFVQKEMAMETGLVLLEGNGGTIQVEEGLPQVEEAQEPDGVEEVKAASQYHRAPLMEELENLEETGLSKGATVIMKHHGSYVQTNREIKAKKSDKTYQFMFRLKVKERSE